MKKILICFFLFFQVIASAATQTAFEKQCSALAAQSNLAPSKKLHKLFDITWDYWMNESPESATYNGFPGHNDKWTDLSPEAFDRRVVELKATLAALKTIDRNKLSKQDKASFDLFKYDQEDEIENKKFGGRYLRVDQMGGPQQEIAQLIASSPTETEKDYEDILARLNTVPTVIDQTKVLMEMGLEKGITPPKITLRDVPDQIKNISEARVEESVLLKPFRSFPASFSEERKRDLRARAISVFENKIRPAFQNFNKFVTNQYIPKCRDSIAWEDLPEGKAWYAHNVRAQTTTNLTPDEIHQIGLSEVARIRKEMDKVMREAKFQGSFKEFTQFLQTDKQFFYGSANELVDGYRILAKKIDPELPKLFGKLPRLTYGVLPVPAYAEKSQTTAYYQPGAPNVGRAGYYFANTYKIETRPKWEMEALTLHESVPGHHLQIALSQEMENVPNFRKYGGYNAFVEGWGLYSESLGYELGMYQDPYSKFGQLTYEIWRAIRLVVDTGMHSKGWSREKAIEYFKENSPKSEHDITVEIDRYIVWAGQALGYKIGQLKIKELRELSQKTLGSKFDIRFFHDAVLENGALPLSVLESNIKEFLKNKQKLK